MHSSPSLSTIKWLYEGNHPIHAGYCDDSARLLCGVSYLRQHFSANDSDVKPQGKRTAVPMRHRLNGSMRTHMRRQQQRGQQLAAAVAAAVSCCWSKNRKPGLGRGSVSNTLLLQTAVLNISRQESVESSNEHQVPPFEVFCIHPPYSLSSSKRRSNPPPSPPTHCALTVFVLALSS